MEFTLEEYQHMMAAMNCLWGDCHESIVECPICSSARVKLNAIIEELKPPERGLIRIEEAPEWLKKLGVNTIERVRE